MRIEDERARQEHIRKVQSVRVAGVMIAVEDLEDVGRREAGEGLWIVTFDLEGLHEQLTGLLPSSPSTSAD